MIGNELAKFGEAAHVQWSLPEAYLLLPFPLSVGVDLEINCEHFVRGRGRRGREGKGERRDRERRKYQVNIRFAGVNGIGSFSTVVEPERTQGRVLLQ